MTTVFALGDPKTLTRDVEEIVVKGASLADFLGQPADRIHLYRYDTSSSSFQPIPFQIDEVDVVHLDQNCDPMEFVPECLASPDDPPVEENCELNFEFDNSREPVPPGTLDPDDEIVFLAHDTGDQAPNLVLWHPGTVSTTRYEIQVNDVDDLGNGPQIVGKGWVYAYLFTVPHAFELPNPYYVDWVPDASADPDRPGQICINPEKDAPPRGFKACGRFQKGPQFDSVFPNKTTYQMRYLGNWIKNRLKIVPAGGSNPTVDVIDRVRMGSGAEDEESWSTCGCPIIIGVKEGPVRVIHYVQGAVSGPTTTRTDFLYPTHTRTTTRVRVHDIPDIHIRFDYLKTSMEGSEVYVEADPDTVADVIDGNEPATSPGQFGNWTQINHAGARLAYFAKETRPIMAGARDYTYEDEDGTTDPGEFEEGAFGNHGVKWSGTLVDMQDLFCDQETPNNPNLKYAQIDESLFITGPGTGTTPEAQAFADQLARPLRHETAKHVKEQAPPPVPPGPTCLLTVDTADPQNGQYLDVKPGLAVETCTDSTVGAVLYRALGFGEFRYVGEFALDETYRDRAVYLGQTYRYLARPQNTLGVEGPASAIVTLTVVDAIAPAPPGNLQVFEQDGALRVTWDRSTSNDAIGYNIYVSTTPGGPYSQVNASLLNVPADEFTAVGLANGTPYYAVVRAEDIAGNEGPDSVEVSGTPGP